MSARSDKFTQAIALQPDNHILYSNRSAAYASKKEWDNALKDAEKTTEIKPDWAKGWGRKGAALHGAGDLVGANDAYEEGLKLDADNAQLKSGLASVQKAMQQEAGALARGWQTRVTLLTISQEASEGTLPAAWARCSAIPT